MTYKEKKDKKKAVFFLKFHLFFNGTIFYVDSL